MMSLESSHVVVKGFVLSAFLSFLVFLHVVLFFVFLHMSIFLPIFSKFVVGPLWICFDPLTHCCWSFLIVVDVVKNPLRRHTHHQTTGPGRGSPFA